MSNRDDYRPGNPEYDYWNDKVLYPSLRHDGDVEATTDQHYDPLAANSSTLASMVGSSIALVLLGWGFAGLILILLWLGGSSESFLFQLIFQVSFWGGIGFIVIMSIAGVIMAITEHPHGKSK